MERISKELSFLESLIKNENGQIITDIYHKLTDIQQYLHFNSYHSKNWIKSIPYTLARRIGTIVTKENLRKIRLKELRTTFHRWGYPTTLINKGFWISWKNTIERTTNPPKKQENEKSLAYAATYDKNNPELLTEIILKYWKT